MTWDVASRVLRPLIVAAGLIAVWQAIVLATGAPPYILPGPRGVAETWLAQAPLLLRHAATTFAEIALGLVLGTVLGCTSAVLMAAVRPVRRWLMPVLVVSQFGSFTAYSMLAVVTLLGPDEKMLGIVLLFVVPVLGVLGLAVAAGAFGIRSINRTRRGTIAAGDPVQTVKGRIELHRSSRNDNRGFDHRVWAGMQEGETAGGQALSAATEVFTVDKALWGELVDGGAQGVEVADRRDAEAAAAGVLDGRVDDGAVVALDGEQLADGLRRPGPGVRVDGVSQAGDGVRYHRGVVVERRLEVVDLPLEFVQPDHGVVREQPEVVDGLLRDEVVLPQDAVQRVETALVGDHPELDVPHMCGPDRGRSQVRSPAGARVGMGDSQSNCPVTSAASASRHSSATETMEFMLTKPWIMPG